MALVINRPPISVVSALLGLLGLLGLLAASWEVSLDRCGLRGGVLITPGGGVWDTETSVVHVELLPVVPVASEEDQPGTADNDDDREFDLTLAFWASCK